MQSRYFGRPTGGARDDGECYDPSQELEHEDAAGVIDQTPTEVHDAHLDLRERLVKQFEIRFQRNQVQWLKFPGKAKELASHPQ